MRHLHLALTDRLLCRIGFRLDFLLYLAESFCRENFGDRRFNAAKRQNERQSGEIYVEVVIHRSGFAWCVVGVLRRGTALIEAEVRDMLPPCQSSKQKRHSSGSNALQRA